MSLKESNTIVTGDHVETGRLVLDDIIHLGDIAGSLFHGDHVIELTGDTKRSLGRHVHTRTPRYVIEYDR